MSTQLDTLNALWTLVPAKHDVWTHVKAGKHAQVRWREVVELVCGALWHLEQTLAFGPLDEEKYEELRDDDREPWVTWSKSRVPTAIQVDSPEATNAQSMLVADAVLRLAGAWDLLEDMAKRGHSPGAKILGTLDAATNEDGSVRPGTDQRIAELLVLRAVRDTFMHGELSIEQRNKRHKHRNALYSSSSYAPRALFEYSTNAIRLMLELFKSDYREGA